MYLFTKKKTVQISDLDCSWVVQIINALNFNLFLKILLLLYILKIDSASNAIHVGYLVNAQ